MKVDIIDTASLNKLAEEENIFVSGIEVDHEIESRLRKSIIPISDCRVVFRLFDPSDVAPGNERPVLIILGPDYLSPIHPTTSGVFLMCTEEGARKLRNTVRSYLAFKRVERIYHLSPDNQDKMNLRYLQEEASQRLDRDIVEGWSIVVRLVDSRPELLTLDKMEFEANLTLQLTKTILEALVQKGWLSKP